MASFQDLANMELERHLKDEILAFARSYHGIGDYDVLVHHSFHTSPLSADVGASTSEASSRCGAPDGQAAELRDHNGDQDQNQNQDESQPQPQPQAQPTYQATLLHHLSSTTAWPEKTHTTHQRQLLRSRACGTRVQALERLRAKLEELVGEVRTGCGLGVVEFVVRDVAGEGWGEGEGEV